MRLDVYFQPRSTAAPFPESMLLGSQTLFAAKHGFGTFWIEAQPFTDPHAVIQCGMSLGLALQWR